VDSCIFIDKIQREIMVCVQKIDRWVGWNAYKAKKKETHLKQDTNCIEWPIQFTNLNLNAGTL
jgi:hypothetical protein